MALVMPEGMKDTINEIRELIGRDVTITVQEGETPCPVCSLDPVTNTSTNSFCIVCDGLYWTPVYSGYTVNGHIRWSYMDRDFWTSGGKIPEGDCKVTIEYTVTSLDYVERSHSWLVDSKTLYLEKHQLRGVRGDNDVSGPNRIVCYLKEEED